MNKYGLEYLYYLSLKRISRFGRLMKFKIQLTI